MRETDFIKQNKEKWSELEHILSLKQKDPDKLSNLFVQVSDDLSYSRTFYKNRSVRVYLNNIAQQVFQSLYEGKKNRWKLFVRFWKEELPHVVYESRKELLLAFIVFLAAVFIGVISYANDPEFAKAILGHEYVEMTKENIRSGDPMAVYKKMHQADMFLGITYNNIYVAFLAFILGILFSLGSLYILIQNGVMLGVFQYFFIKQGLFKESALAIWLHGTLEISSIIIAGAAGITLGSGLVFPGTLSRLQAFQLSAQRGLKLLVAIVPILIMAATIESFLTRYTDAPDALRLSIILLSLILIVGYFIIYPWLKARKGFAEPLRPGKLAAASRQELNFKEIKQNGEIFTAIFFFYRTRLKLVLITTLISTILYCSIALLLYPDLLKSRFNFYTPVAAIFSNTIYIRRLFDYEHYPLMALLNSFSLSLPVFLTNFHLYKESVKDEKQPVLTLRYFLRYYSQCFLAFGLLNLLLFAATPLNTILFVLTLPFILLALFALFCEGGLINGLKQAFALAFHSFAKFGGLFLLLSLVAYIYFLIFNSPLVYIYYEALNINLRLSSENSTRLFIALIIFTGVFALQLLAPLFGLGKGLLYFSLKEIKEASALNENIKKFGQKKR